VHDIIIIQDYDLFIFSYVTIIIIIIIIIFINSTVLSKIRCADNNISCFFPFVS